MLMISLLTAGAANAAETNPLADKVRSANQRFADVAVAKSEGYAPIPCVSGPDGSGAMGVHYVNQKLIDDPAVDVGKPEAVLYEPGADGKLELVAVEYITPKGPAALGNQLFSFVNAPNRYGLPPLTHAEFRLISRQAEQQAPAVRAFGQLLTEMSALALP